MTTLNIPSSPSQGATYEANGVVYTWDGTKWKADSSYVSNLNGGQLAGFRNQLINSSFEFWQRGDPPLAGASAYTVDRWYTNARVGNVERQVNNLPPGSTFGCKMNTIDAGNLGLFQIRQAIELSMGGASYDIPSAGPFAIGSVWTTSVWSNQPISLSLSFAQSVNVGNKVDIIPDKSVMVNTGETSGEYTKYTFTSDPISAGPLSDSSCLLLRFSADIQDVNANWKIVQPQLEPGPVATPIEHRPIGTELALCQRYFFTASVSSGMPCVNGSVNGSDARQTNFRHPVYMRDTPTIINTGGASNGTVTSITGGRKSTTVTGKANGNSQIMLVNTCTFDAEL